MLLLNWSTACGRQLCRRARRTWLMVAAAVTVLLLHTLLLGETLSPQHRPLSLATLWHRPGPAPLSGRRLLARMLYLDSGPHNALCSDLASGHIASHSQLLSQVPLPPRGPSLPRANSSQPWRWGEREEVEEWLEGRQKVEKKVEEEEEFCRRLRTVHGFGRWPVTRQEELFPLAFSFKMHSDPDMFQRLLSTLWRPHNLYCVHVDSKAPQHVQDRVAHLARCLPNVQLPQRRWDVVYASILSLRADIECAMLALSSAIPWRYHINLCGTEFPLKTNLEMVQILQALDGANDVENYPPEKRFRELSFTYISVIKAGQNRFSDKLKAPFWHKWVELRKGSAYNSLSRPFLQWAFQDQVGCMLGSA